MTIRNRRAWLLACLTTALVGLVPAAQASRHSSLPFTPGHYSGFTDQTCPAQPLPAGVCKPGERLPISFTLSGSLARNVQTIVVLHCLEQPKTVVHAVSVPRSRVVFRGKKAFFQNLRNLAAGMGHDTVSGMVQGQAALGDVQSLLPVNAAGQLDGHGENVCDISPVHWKAKRAG
jgi:hypothetical protein